MPISFIRLEKCYDKSTTRLMAAATLWTMRESVRASFETEGKATCHAGPPPSGRSEDELATRPAALKGRLAPIRVVQGATAVCTHSEPQRLPSSSGEAEAEAARASGLDY